MSRVWVALFSQTGSELKNIQDILGKRPDYVLTNSKFDIVDDIEIALNSKHDDLMNYLHILHEKNQDKNILVTLHGYLRIIPPDVCDKFEMYNGHPALISRYEELKGKDPQERTWNEKEKYPLIGSVVHKVTPGVDEGEIVSEVAYTNRCSDINELYSKLKQSSLEAWYWFLRDRV